MDNNLTDLQDNLLTMMKWFDSVCRSNGLRYYALGGTMIGAVRHEGFIPWDDDIDVGMPRKDYERLKNILGNTIHDHYVLETPSSSDICFSYPYSKLYDINTTLIENGKRPVKRGTFLDIFQIDGLGDSEVEAKKLYQKYRKKYRFFISRVAAIRKGRGCLKNAAIVLSRLIPFVNDRTLRIKLETPSEISDFDTSKWVSYLYGNWGVREVMPREVFGHPADYKFEDMIIMGVSNYDEYLTRVYGDWRKLPPKEKQITHHDFAYLDLKQSYKK